jgi:hypothetical protein
MTSNKLILYVGLLALGIILGSYVCRSGIENFVDVTQCDVCSHTPCDCIPPKPVSASSLSSLTRSAPGPAPTPVGNTQQQCPTIDWSKYVLKSSIPPCPPQPDMSRYMLKSDCPAPPDMSKYVLKSSVPVCPPCVSTCNKPCKIGDCPPCPRPRCPVVQCPEPKSCPPCAPVEPPRCPEPHVTCKARYEPEEQWMVRPLLSSIRQI